MIKEALSICCRSWRKGSIYFTFILFHDRCADGLTDGCRVADVNAMGNKKCLGAADLVIVIDESGSISKQEWNQFTNFVKHVVGAFPIRQSHTRVGLLKFSDGVKIAFHLNEHNSSKPVQDAIASLSPGGGGTLIAPALRSAREKMLSASNGARDGTTPKILILLTDGEAGDAESELQKEAQLLKADGVKVFTVGVTNQVDEAQLKKIASLPDNFFYASDFAALNAVMEEKLVDSSCKESNKTDAPIGQ